MKKDKKLLIKDLVEALEMESTDFESYYNIKTKQIITVSSTDYEIYNRYENGYDIDADWMQESIDLVEEIEYSDDYIKTPTYYDLNMWQIMNQFRMTLDDNVSEIIRIGITGKGAFSRFSQLIHHYDLTEDWYKFKSDKLTEIAIEWCENHEIIYSIE